jgi:hypothetical protein
VHAVPKDRKQVVAEAVDAELLSRVAHWIRLAETSENVWRSQTFSLCDGMERHSASTRVDQAAQPRNYRQNPHVREMCRG